MPGGATQTGEEGADAAALSSGGAAEGDDLTL